jgi:hypothetical protein
LDNITREYVLRALNEKIKRVGEYALWQNNIIESSERELRTNKGSTQIIGGFGVSTQFDESTSTRLLKEAKGNKERADNNLKNYKHAKEEILKM